MTGLSSRRVSIPRTFFCISLVVLCLVLSAAPEPSHADEDQYKSQRWGVPARAASASELKVGDLYAVVVGVSKYKDTRIPALSVSDKDARSIAEFLKTQKNLFKDIHVSLFVNENATKKALETQLFYKLKPAGKDDTVIVFLSGHGTDDPKNPGEFFFLPYDADSEFVAVGGIHMNRQWFVDKLDSKRVLIIADACHAGGFAGSGVKRLPPSLDKFMGQFKETEGRVFITSSRADELSKESPEFGHSLFTHFLLEGLSGKAADQDGVVSLKALYDYVYDKTRKASDFYQSPQMEGKLVGKFPVALVRADIRPVPQAAPQKPSPTPIQQAFEMESKARTRADTENALETYQEALRIFEKTAGSEKEIGATLNKIGEIYQLWGEYAKALEYYEKSVAITRKVGDVKQEGETQNNIGLVYQSLGKYAKALNFYEESLKITKKIHDAKGEANTLGSIGSLKAMMAEYGDAENVMNQNMKIFEKLGIPTSMVKDALANLYLDAGDLTKAERLIKDTDSSASHGRLAFLKSDYPSAAQFYEKDVKSAEKTGNVDSLFCSYTGLARAYEKMDKYQKAEDYYEKAMNLTEEIRSGLSPSERSNFFEVTIGGFLRSDPARGLARLKLKRNLTDGGIESSELTKARAFSDHLAETSLAGAPGIPRETVEREKSLVTKLAALKNNLAKTDRDKHPEKHDTLSKELKVSQSNLNAFVDGLWRHNPAYAAAKYSRPVPLALSALKPDECVVMFDILGEGVGVKLIHNKKIAKTFYIKWDQKDLENDVKKFRGPLDKLLLKEFDPDLARSLYDKLLLPALKDVPKGTPIIIIPDGILAALPFEALVTGGKTTWSKVEMDWPQRFKDYPDGLTYLGDEHPVSYYQSITALTLVRTRSNQNKPTERLLVIADPVSDFSDPRARLASKEYIQLVAAVEQPADDTVGGIRLPRLHETGVLADNLQKMYGSNCLALTGLKANKADFLSKIAPKIDSYGSVVFATHAVMSTNVPGLMEPFFVLTMVPQGTDGFLKMSDILSLKMNADIVALTANQSGLGKYVSGEGVMSMGRAFQYAGAKSVLVTLWDCVEKSAVSLTENFFKRRKEGKTKLEALQAARNYIRNAGYKHPFFWAAFRLVGEVN